jgi:toluene monooxygenase electron transfer component
MCQCAAAADLLVEVPKFVHAAAPGACIPEACTGVVRAPRRVAPDVMAFGVELAEPRDFDAGQFMLLAPPGMAGYRAYSMCNFERGARRLEFVVKRKPDGRFSSGSFPRIARESSSALSAPSAEPRSIPRSPRISCAWPAAPASRE